MKEKKCTIDDFKKKYEGFRKKYNLPEFKKLNEDFDILRICDVETETFLREIRKVMVDKILAYLRFLEIFLNPSQGQMFLLVLIKGMNGPEKKIIEEVYGKLAKMEIEVIGLDTNYSEKKEAEFIKRTFNEWKSIKDEMEKLVDSFERSWKQKIEKKKGESYFG